MAQKSQIPALTGLRGLAVLAVLFEHYAVWCSPYSLEHAPLWLIHFVNTAAAGMTLFFTLSGFVIAYNYWDLDWARSPIRSFTRFFYLRLSRLYPMLILFILIGIKIDTDSPQLTAMLPKLTPTVVTSTQSWLPLKIGGSNAVSLPGFGLSWSISTEIGMYILFAAWIALFAALPRIARTSAMLASGAAIVLAGFMIPYHIAPLGTWLAGSVPTPFESLNSNEAAYWLTYMSPYYRFSEFMLGVGAAVIVLQGYDMSLRPVLSVLAVAASLYLIGSYLDGLWPFAPTWFAWGPHDMIEAACFAAIMANGRAPGPINQFLSARWLILVGTISYSLYLLQSIATHYTGATPVEPFDFTLLPWTAFNMGLTLCLSIALAYGGYHLIEMPSQAWLRSLMFRRRTPIQIPVVTAEGSAAD